MRPVIDIHCDLLWYLANHSRRSVFHPEVRCSLPQLREGHVQLQTMAVFTLTEPGSTRKAQSQINHFAQLPKAHSGDFSIVKNYDRIKAYSKDQAIQILLSIENASGIFEEEESLTIGFQRLQSLEKDVGKVFYLSLTWNFENRFGGGALTKVGLKKDGELLLDFLHDKKIAVDLSHASDLLAEEIFNYVDKKGLQIPLIASHSNFRAVSDVPRNLSDPIAKEILRRKGIIGFVLCKDFVGAKDIFNLVKQYEHLLKLGGAKQSCFGADFFYEGDLPLQFQRPADQLFFENYSNAGAYEKIFDQWQKHLGLNEEMLDDVAHRNFISFYSENFLLS